MSSSLLLVMLPGLSRHQWLECFHLAASKQEQPHCLFCHFTTRTLYTCGLHIRSYPCLTLFMGNRWSRIKISNRPSGRGCVWFFFLFLVSHFTEFSAVFKKKAKRVEKGEWHPDAWLCAESLYMGTDGHLSSPWQALFGDVSTRICGSTSLWELWVPQWGFCSGSPAQPRGSPDTWRTPSSSCDTHGLPPCETLRPRVSVRMWFRLKHTYTYLPGPSHYNQAAFWVHGTFTQRGKWSSV